MNLKALSYKLRRDAINIICAGKTGHIGGDMSVMEILVELYFKQMNISPENMDDENRDLFILSKGHSMEAYYAVLAEKNFVNLDDIIKNFSKFGSKYIGHPNNKLPGIEMNSGSLGHGLPVCVGMAIASKMDKKIIEYTLLWVTESWRKALCGKARWLRGSISWIIYARLSTETVCKFPVTQKILWDMMTCMKGLKVLAGLLLMLKTEMILMSLTPRLKKLKL